MDANRYQVLRDCEHCDGYGSVEVYCDDCGEELYTNNQADSDAVLNPDDDDLCKQCLENRREDQ